MHNVIVDTNLWQFGYIRPTQEAFIDLHLEINKFLLSILINPDINIGISTYQMAEVLEILRKSGLAKDKINKIFENFKLTKFKVVPLTNSHINEMTRF